MTAIPVAIASKCSTTKCTSPTAGYIGVGGVIKFQSFTYRGLDKLWSHNASTGVFTLNSNCIYVFEAECLMRTSQTRIGNVQYAIVDNATGNEVADGYRSVLKFYGEADYYGAFNTTGDELAMAVVDGSSISSVRLEIVASQQASAFSVDPNPSVTGYYKTGTRMIITEYQP
jgi:hypothetical protein